MRDAAIIGGGHNGLVAAFYLAKAGVRTVVFERRDEVGGGAVTAEIHPGFRCPTLSHEVLLHARVVREMDLLRHGLELIAPAATVCSLPVDGPPLVLHADAGRSAEALRPFSARDAGAYVSYRAAIERIASVLAAAFEAPPPHIDAPDRSDLWNLLRTGSRFRRLGRRDGYRLLRWLPMPVADLMHEWFEHEHLRAALAAPGLSGTMLGPRSAGSALVLLMREAHRRLSGHALVQARGGPGSVTAALAAAARAAGAEIRTGARVERLVVESGRVAGIVVNGQTVATGCVVSAADPKATLLGLVDPAELAPEFALKMRNYRAAGTIAKVNLALASLPAFGVAPDVLGGRIHIGPELDYLERAFDRAKYGEFSESPWLDIRIPTVVDPSLAPAGAHVASIYVHYAPYRLRGAGWDAARDALLEATLDVIERHAAGVRARVVAAQVLTPADLERDYAFTGGHVFHGELAPDQLYTMRPLLGFADYTTPIHGLFLCGAGTHPGGFFTGASGRLAARKVLSSREI